MKKDSKEIINQLLDSLNTIDSSDIPNIDLYMDQVTTFMDRHLSHSKRFDEDKVLTKTMINNYTKNNLLPPPEKKKYSKDHVLMLTFIYYFKNILSINDIKAILTPIRERHFNAKTNLTLEDIYMEIIALLKNRKEGARTDILRDMEKCNSLFENCPADEQEFLKTFSLIASLSFDIYIKKQIIEGIIDNLNLESAEKNQEKQKAKKEEPKAGKSKEENSD